MCLDDLRSTHDQTLAGRSGTVAERVVHLGFIDFPHPAIAAAMAGWGWGAARMSSAPGAPA